MPFTIQDGTTGTKGLQITGESKAACDSITRNRQSFINSNYGKLFTVKYNVTPSSANQYFFHIKNLGQKRLHVSRIICRASALGSILIRGVTGTATPVAEGVAQQVNKTVGVTSGTMNATIIQGTSMTGLTDVGEQQRVSIPVRLLNEDITRDFMGDIILGQGVGLGFFWDTAPALLIGTIDIYEEQIVDSIKVDD